MKDNSNSLDEFHETIDMVTQNSSFSIQLLNKDKDRESIQLILSYKHKPDTIPIKETIEIAKGIRESTNDQVPSLCINGVVEGIEAPEPLTFHIDPNGPIEIE